MKKVLQIENWSYFSRAQIWCPTDNKNVNVSMLCDRYTENYLESLFSGEKTKSQVTYRVQSLLVFS